MSSGKTSFTPYDKTSFTLRHRFLVVVGPVGKWEVTVFGGQFPLFHPAGVWTPTAFLLG